MRSNDVGVFRSRVDFERHRDARNGFWSVATAYLEVLETPPLVAISHDPEFPNRKLGAQMIEYKVDCDNAVKAALDDNPSLVEDFHKLIRGSDVPHANHIIAKCAKQFRQFQLLPHLY